MVRPKFAKELVAQLCGAASPDRSFVERAASAGNKGSQCVGSCCPNSGLVALCSYAAPSQTGRSRVHDTAAALRIVVSRHGPQHSRYIRFRLRPLTCRRRTRSTLLGLDVQRLFRAQRDADEGHLRKAVCQRRSIGPLESTRHLRPRPLGLR